MVFAQRHEEIYYRMKVLLKILLQTLFVGKRFQKLSLVFGLLAAWGCSDSPDTPTEETSGGRLDPAEIQTRAEMGEPAAQYALGKIYMTGDDVEADLSSAWQWIRKSAEQGYAPAQYELGSFYTLKGPQQNFAEAADWLHRAAKQNYLHAQTSLGMLYAAGRGVGQDFAQAFAWLTLAADSGDASANAAQQQVLEVITEEELNLGLQLTDRYRRILNNADDNP